MRSQHSLLLGPWVASWVHIPDWTPYYPPLSTTSRLYPSLGTRASSRHLMCHTCRGAAGGHVDMLTRHLLLVELQLMAQHSCFLLG
jgi:hypothetical protein